MKINLNAHSLETLQKGFINQGARAGKIGEDELQIIAKELEAIVASGKTFTVKTVVKIIQDKKLANYENCEKPEQAMRTAGRKALISLGVIKVNKKASKEPEAPKSDKV